MFVQEILLLSLIVVTAYLGPMIVRRSVPGNRTYGWMLILNLALAVVAFAAGRAEEPVAGVLGVVAIGAGFFLVIVPPVLRGLARRAVLAERMRIAATLLDLRELLQPGMGAAQERELVLAIAAVRDGNIDSAIDVLLKAKGESSDLAARRHLDERIVTTFLFAREWKRAIAHYEETLVGPNASVSPHLVVEMVRAYCELRDLSGAADLVARIECSPAVEEPTLKGLVNRARMVFLAFVGRTRAVDQLLGENGPFGDMPTAARNFWAGVARVNAGDRKGALTYLKAAAKHAGRDRRARDLALSMLDSLEDPGVVGPHVVPAPVAELADRLVERSQQSTGTGTNIRAPKMSNVDWRKVPITCSLIVLNVACALAIGWIFHGASDLGALVQVGANVKSAVDVGEWWRLPASMFLHVGVLHLVMNMVNLWILGRLLEQMFGRLRFFAVYMLAGIGGALASYGLGPPGMSAGASGAIMGVLGAVVVELALFHHSYPQRWRRSLLGILVFLTVSFVGIGFVVEVADQYAHVAGLLVGGIAAGIVSPQSPLSRSLVTKALTWLLVLVGVAALGYGGYGSFTSSFRETIAKYPRETRVINGFAIAVPSTWKAFEGEDGVELVDVSPHTLFEFHVRPATGDVSDHIADRLEKIEQGERGLKKVRRATSLRISLPAPWQSRELTVIDDSIGGELKYRIVVFAQIVGQELWIGSFFTFDAIAAEMTTVLSEALQSLNRIK